jgi:hypothetical protein
MVTAFDKSPKLRNSSKNLKIPISYFKKELIYVEIKHNGKQKFVFKTSKT